MKHVEFCAALVFLTACAAGDLPEAAEAAKTALHHHEEDAGAENHSAVLRDAKGEEIGEIRFVANGDTTWVEVDAYLPGASAGIRGMHIHANDNPENGEGCVADPTQPASTHFSSADGHFTAQGAGHGHHAGDLPALFVTHSGEASLRFLTDRFHSEDVIGRAVILHELPDNYGNIPVGDKPDQYTPNDPAASDLTTRTGNAGARYACGVIE